jgi:integrase
VIVVLWRAGLRVQEALALTEHDLDRRRGSVLVCSGKGGRRREVGMDEWGWEQLRSWLSARRVAGWAAVLRHRRHYTWARRWLARVRGRARGGANTIRLRAPRRAGGYRFRLAASTADGRGASAVLVVRRARRTRR